MIRDAQILLIFSKPKQGKTEILSQLDDNLLIDTEDGSDFVSGLKVKVSSWAELKRLYAELKKGDVTYNYITFDTTSGLEEIAKEYAKELYQKTPMGEKWGKPDPKTGKVKPGQDDIVSLPNGAGYLYLRKAFINIINLFKPFAKKCLILSGHVKDKLVSKYGEEIQELTLDLAGQLSRIVQSKVDAVGLMYREGNEAFINFNGGGDSIVEARPEHLTGKLINISTKNTETGEIITRWDQIFLDL